jgi:hypothetical protein
MEWLELRVVFANVCRIHRARARGGRSIRGIEHLVSKLRVYRLHFDARERLRLITFVISVKVAVGGSSAFAIAYSATV